MNALGNAAMTRVLISLAVFAFLALATPFAVQAAPAAGGATSLEELLRQVRETRAEEAKINAEREAQFKADQANQQKLLADAQAAFNAAEADSNRLSAEYDANEQAIKTMQATLNERQGELGELFGVTRQVAGDASTVFSQSIISPQFPDRVEFLRGLAASSKLPSITELERLWFEMTNEMIETGKVVKRTATVAQKDGVSNDVEIVRVGPFTITAADRFVSYESSTGTYRILDRQPPSEFGSAMAALASAADGYHPAVVDPGRGVLIQLYSERPTLMERIELGEAVGYVILLVGFIGIVVWIYQLIFLFLERGKVEAQMKDLDNPREDNSLGRVLKAFRGDANRIEEESEVAELRISEAVLREVPRLERFQAFLRLAVAAGPLLGLVGTVVGMIITFQSITESGSSDPRLMAQGIGQAMIATVLGLGIAIPLLFANALLVALSKRIVQMLDEQSAGLLAESIERRLRA